MNTISKTYALKWQHKDYCNYKWSVCGKLFNCKTGFEIKKTFNNGSIGYWIKGKFITLNKLRNQLTKIEDTKCPF